MQAAGRTRVVQAYVWITGIVTLFVFVQGGLIGAWLYKPAEDWILDTHGDVGSVIGFVAIVPFLLALRARFPRRPRAKSTPRRQAGAGDPMSRIDLPGPPA